MGGDSDLLGGESALTFSDSIKDGVSDASESVLFSVLDAVVLQLAMPRHRHSRRPLGIRIIGSIQIVGTEESVEFALGSQR